jgi:acyl-CoA dehydrogenase
MMIFGQGAMRCHPFVLKELQAAAIEDKKEALVAFDKAVFGHIGFAVANTVRSIWFSLTNGAFSSAPFTDETARYYKLMQGYSANLALLTDVSMGVLGGDLKRRERLSARLGDILSGIYMGSTTLKRFDEEGRLKEDLPLLHWAMQTTLHDIETAIEDFLANFPNKAIAVALRVMVLPVGRRVGKPSDKTEHAIAKMLQTPSTSRSRLGHGQYLSREDGSLFGDLEQTLDDVLLCEPIFDRICKHKKAKLPFTRLDVLADEALAEGIIDQSEADLMHKTEAGRLRTINVDDFDHEELVAKINSSTVAKKKSGKAA